MLAGNSTGVPSIISTSPCQVGGNLQRLSLEELHLQDLVEEGTAWLPSMYPGVVLFPALTMT